MTNTNLVWRLRNQLSVEDIEKMISLKIITPEEAKKLAFNEADIADEFRALKEQVEFLKDLVSKLTTSKPQVTWNYVTSYTPRVGTWTTSNLIGSSTMSNIATSAGYDLAK